MSYFTALGLEEEPFSNSPSPDFFFHVPGRVEVLNLLEVSVRLRRGLNVVLGEVGTGKTTLCRQFIRYLGEDETFVTFLLLDPYFASPMEFLRVFYGMLFRMPAPVDVTEWQLKEDVKAELLHRAVDRNQIVTLILDEGQKIQDHCLELLRELLNFETNQNKLLQIVIFAQDEFKQTLDRYENLVDRLDSLHRLRPLSFLEMRNMIRYRLELAGGGQTPPELFTTGAYWAIYRLTRGYPRKVVTLCHKTMLALLMLGRSKATLAIVYKAAGRNVPHVKWGAAGAACAGCVAAAFLYVMPPSVPEHLQDAAAPLIDVAESRPEAPELAAMPHEVKASAMQQGLEAAAVPDSESSAAEMSMTPSVAPADGEIAAASEAVKEEPLKPAATTAPAAETTVEAPVAAAGSPAAEGKTLGSMPLGKGELLSRAISKVYGAYRTAYLEKLLQANPHISDPDRVAAGTVITYPQIVTAETRDMGEGFWLRLGTYETLQKAAAALDSPDFKGREVRLLPVSDSSGIRFHIVASRLYRKETQARDALTSLPASLQARALIVRDWESGAVLFTDRAVWGESLARR